MAHTWVYGGQTVSDTTHHLLYHGQNLSKAYHHGDLIWDKTVRDEGYDVCFWDWDGTLVAHYSALSFLTQVNKTRAFPPGLHRKWNASMLEARCIALQRIYQNLPRHYGDDDTALLEPDGFNWEINELCFFVARYGYADVGLLYKCEGLVAWVAVPSAGTKDIGLYSTSGSITVDYGDGTTSTYSRAFTYTTYNVGTANPETHYYTEPGIYIIRAQGDIGFGGMGNCIHNTYYVWSWITTFQGRNYTSAMDGNASAKSPNQFLLGIYMDKGVHVTTGAFKGCMYCCAFGFGNNVTLSSVESIMEECLQNRHISIPRHITDLGSSDNYTTTRGSGSFMVHKNAYGVSTMAMFHSISLPPTWVGPLWLTGCWLERIILPELTEGIRHFADCTGDLKLLVLTGGINTSIPSTYTFSFADKNDDFKAYVPAYVRTARAAEIGVDTSGIEGDWVDGPSLYQQLFSKAAFSDRIEAAPHYTVNGYGYDATEW